MWLFLKYDTLRGMLENPGAELSENLVNIQNHWLNENSFAAEAGRVYLDHNATTPPAPPIKREIVNWLEAWGNPSSIHWAGRGPKAVLRESRQKIADLVGASPLEIIFTAGGSESNNLALKGVFEAISSQPGHPQAGRRRWITSRVEHPSVLKVFESLRKKGADVCYVEVDRHGQVNWDHYLSLLNGDTALVSMMLANNETGSIYPIKKMAKEARKVGALFHTDAVQALGKLPLSVEHLGVDLASFSGHKFYALKGAGVLYCRRGVAVERLIDGGGQERHRRAGTENVLAIRSLAAVACWKTAIEAMAAHQGRLRDEMQAAILAEIPGVTVNGGEKRLPNTMNLSIEGVDGESLLMNLDLKGFGVSTGAACSSGSPEPSPALLAMGLTFQEAQSSLRVSIGWGTRREHLDRFVQALKEVVTRLRGLAKDKFSENVQENRF